MGFSTPSNTDWVLQFNSILTLTAQRQPRPHRLRAPSHKTVPSLRHQSQGVAPQVSHNFCPAWLQIGGSHKPPVRFSNLVELLTEPRETVYLLLPIYDKGFTPGAATWKGCTGPGVWEGAWRVPGAPPSQTSRCSPTWRLSKALA